MEIPIIQFPNENKEFIDNPYPFLQEIREKSAVVLDEFTNLQLITRFEDVKGVQTSKNFSSSPAEGFEQTSSGLIKKEEFKYFYKTEEFSLLNLEGQLHGDLRNLVAKATSYGN